MYLRVLAQNDIPDMPAIPGGNARKELWETLSFRKLVRHPNDSCKLSSGLWETSWLKETTNITRHEAIIKQTII